MTARAVAVDHKAGATPIRRGPRKSPPHSPRSLASRYPSPDGQVRKSVPR